MDILELKTEASFLYSLPKKKKILKFQNQETTSQVCIHHFVKLSFDEEDFD